MDLKSSSEIDDRSEVTELFLFMVFIIFMVTVIFRHYVHSIHDFESCIHLYSHIRDFRCKHIHWHWSYKTLQDSAFISVSQQYNAHQLYWVNFEKNYCLVIVPLISPRSARLYFFFLQQQHSFGMLNSDLIFYPNFKPLYHPQKIRKHIAAFPHSCRYRVSQNKQSLVPLLVVLKVVYFKTPCTTNIFYLPL